MEKIIKTEAGYRAVKMDSSSSLKDFSLDRRKYYKKYINDSYNEDDEKTNVAIMMGHLVECLLLEPERFDDKFYISACISPPTGLMLAFVDGLYLAAKDATNEDGTITASFEALSKIAYEKSGFKLSYDAVINKFADSDAEVYFEEICEVRTKKLTVITANDLSNAEKIVTGLQESFITRAVVNRKTNEQYTVLIQHQVEGYEVCGHLFKSMKDKTIIDHVNKTIQTYDLKCSWSVERFYRDYYLTRRSYIQAYLYKRADIFMRDNDPALKDYKVNNPMFIVCDSINYYSPLIYSLDDGDMEDAYNGFESRGRLYPGVKDIIEDLDWALENDIWNISKSNYLSNGIINIKNER